MSGIMSMLLGAVSSVAVAVDEFFNRVTLLLPGNGTNGAQNNTFLDSSTNNFTITRNGNTTQGTFSPFSQTGWSNFFGGSDALTLPSTSSLSFGTGDFCVEFWIFRTVSSAASGIFSNSASSGGGDAQFEIQINSSLKVVLLGWNTTFMTGTTNVNNNTWNHIAVVRSGTSMAMFVNGTRDATATSSNNFSSTNAFNIGRQATGASNLTGYLSNLRAVKGSSVYDPSSSSITVPTAPLTNITNTSLLTCQSNRFVDNGTANSGSGFAVTTVGTPSVQAFSPLAPTAAYDAATVGGSGYFDGTGDTLSISNNAALNVGSGNFCIEAWFYASTLASQQIVISNAGASGSDNTQIDIVSSNVRFASSATVWLTSSGTVAANSWNHVAVSRSGTTLSLFVNGARQATATNSTNFANANNYATIVGGYPPSTTSFTGYISNARVVKGSSVYDPTQTTLTIPTAPLTAITNTSLLTNFTNAGITDATAKNVLETVGNAQISTTQSKFGGSSMYFDGTGDLLFSPASQNYSFPGDFTIECWINTSTTSTEGGAYRRIFATGPDAVTSLQIVFSDGSTASGNISVVTNAFVLSGNINAATGAWVHVALARSGSSMRLFVGGAQSGSTYTTTQAFTGGATNGLYVGSSSGGTGRYLGYIDDFRITVGYARYTANFTAPTAAFPLQ